MNKKNMGRKFKVGDKVVFTKEAIDSSMFHKSIQVGDLAVVKSVKSCVGGSFPTNVLPERDGLWLQCVDDYEPKVYEWFEHADAKKEHKKKRKHFRMGDLVVLKDEVNTSEVAIYNNIQKGVVAMINSEEYNGVLRVHFFTKEGYESDRVKIEALRLATKKERKSFRKYKVAKIVYDNASEDEQDTEIATKEIPPEYDVKVGDYVKITENADGHPVGTVGFVAEIEEVPEGYCNHVVVSDFDDNCWNEHNVKLVHRATLTCEDEDNSEPNSAVTPATEEEKVVMLGDNLINRYTESIYKVILIDDIFESELPYHITSKNESMWISDGTVVQDYGKLLEDGRVYDWVTDTTFANVESWTNSAK